MPQNPDFSKLKRVTVANQVIQLVEDSFQVKTNVGMKPVTESLHEAIDLIQHE